MEERSVEEANPSIPLKCNLLLGSGSVSACSLGTSEVRVAGSRGRHELRLKLTSCQLQWRRASREGEGHGSSTTPNHAQRLPEQLRTNPHLTFKARLLLYGQHKSWPGSRKAGLPASKSLVNPFETED
ncbi:unnamed protein product [Gadus morhua 'NCC']